MQDSSISKTVPTTEKEKSDNKPHLNREAITSQVDTSNRQSSIVRNTRENSPDFSRQRQDKRSTN